MNSDASRDLEGFVERFFTSRGAVVERHAAGLEVLAPSELAERIGIPNHCHLTVDEASPVSLGVNYGSPLLEKITQTAGEPIPLSVVQLAFHYLKRQGFDRLVNDGFTFHGAVVQVDRTAEVVAEYLLLNCRFLAQSDEQKEGLIPLAFNLATGARVGDLEAMLDTVEKRFESGGHCDALDAGKIDAVVQWVQRQAPALIAARIQPFRDSMNRRFSRDVANLEGYYAELKQEMADTLTRSGLSAQLIAERKAKIALLPEEMAKKKNDLFKKYSIKVRLDLCGAMLIRTPAVKLFCKAAVGRRHKAFSLFYNPIDKSLDPLVCDGCGNTATSIRFCNRMHLLCPQCQTGCPACAA
jgi:uncharacterized small protein (DUF1192 family)